MSAMAAMRSGAGYVTVATAEQLQSTFAVRLLEAMTIGLPSQDGGLAMNAIEPALKAIERADAVVLGPGLGRMPDTQAFVRELLGRIGVPLVIDADGLNALAEAFPAGLPEREAPTVLTPHAGELGRLLGVESAEVGRRRLAHAREAAARAQAIVVLKGDDTLVAAPDGAVAISPGGAPALATAGTGDVLSGVVGALLAKGLSAQHAACAAVLGHVRAGRLAAEPYGPDGVIASDVIEHLRPAFKL
jgi:NAD(P)H-hydrate epimerase